MKKVANCAFRRLVLIERKRTIVLFSSDLCYYCGDAKKVLNKIKKKTEGIEFIELDYIKDRNLALQYSVMFLPTVLFFEDGNVKGIIEGLKKKSRYYEKVSVIFNVKVK